jgi:hypothetical protein
VFIHFQYLKFPRGIHPATCAGACWNTSKLEDAQDELVEKDTTGRELTISQGETQVIAMTAWWFGTMEF